MSVENMSVAEYMAQAQRLGLAPKKRRKLEANTLKACLEWLKDHNIPAWRNNTGKMEVRDKHGNPRFIAFGASGSPDIHGIARGGKYLGIETKSPTGKLSPNQICWKMMVERAGGIYIVARSVDDIEACRELLI